MSPTEVEATTTLVQHSIYTCVPTREFQKIYTPPVKAFEKQRGAFPISTGWQSCQTLDNYPPIYAIVRNKHWSKLDLEMTGPKRVVPAGWGLGFQKTTDRLSKTQ